MPDYDDVVGGLPVRFKYCRVPPNDFGLSPEEILLSDDKELNAWVSLKKAVAFRDETEEQEDLSRYQVKRNYLRYKRKILKSLFREAKDEATPDEEVRGKRKRRRRKGKSSLHVKEAAETGAEARGEEQGTGKAKRKQRERKRVKTVDEERLRSYGFTSRTEMKRRRLL